MPTNTVLVGVEGQSFFKVIETAENGKKKNNIYVFFYTNRHKVNKKLIKNNVRV